MTTKHEGHLLKNQRILALRHDLLNQSDIIHLLCNSKCVSESAEFSIHIASSLESLLLLFSICRICLTTKKVDTNTFEVVFVAKVVKFAKTFNFHQKINCFCLFVMVDKLRNYLVNKLQNIIDWFALFDARLILSADLASKTSKVLVAPAN